MTQYRWVCRKTVDRKTSTVINAALEAMLQVRGVIPKNPRAKYPKGNSEQSKSQVERAIIDCVWDPCRMKGSCTHSPAGMWPHSNAQQLRFRAAASEVWVLHFEV